MSFISGNAIAYDICVFLRTYSKRPAVMRVKDTPGRNMQHMNAPED